MPTQSDRHDLHDQLLVVSLAAGDLAGTDRDLATALITDCHDCAQLHDDLIAIARATATLPAAARTRDFRLSPGDAARLRPAGWRRFATAFASSRLLVSRQVGVGLTTIGLAGLLLSVLPSMSLGMGSAAASPAPARVAAPAASSAEGAGSNASAAPSARYGTNDTAGSLSAPSGSASAAAPAPSAAPSGSGVALAPAAGSPKNLSDRNLSNAQGSREDGGTTATTPEPAPASVSVLPIVSVLFVLAGLALLIARRIVRRMVAG